MLDEGEISESYIFMFNSFVKRYIKINADSYGYFNTERY